MNTYRISIYAGVMATIATAALLCAGVASAQTVPAGSLSVSMSAAPSVPAGSTQITLADVTLMNASSTIVMVPSLPISATFNGSTANQFTNCSIENTATLGTSITPTASLSGTGQNFTFAAPMSILPGTSQTFALVCDIDPSTPVGGSVLLSLTPGSIPATVNGTAISPSAANGATGPLSGSIAITAGPVGGGSTGSTGGTTGGTPSTPNTGAGGNAASTIALLGASLLVASLGFFALKRKSL